ncbi:MAG: PDZ domain-containing protein [Gemmatimonadetes bacterium]|nr:PDZ domain-containing protein [Gemmatimonadota bacterium]
MNKTRSILTLAALAIGIGVLPAAAQERERRRELERQERDVREQLRDIERELRGLRRQTGFLGPGVVTFSTNRAQLGVFVQTAANESTDDIGALLESVTSRGPAAEAGLEGGDIITSFDGEQLAGRYPAADRDESEPAKKLIDLIREHEPDDEVTVEYQRDGQTHSTMVTLGEGDIWAGSFGFTSPGGVAWAMPRVDVRVPQVNFRSRGGDLTIISMFGDLWSDIELVSLNEDLGRYFGASEGVLVIHPPDDDAVALVSGDVILSIDGRDPRTPSRALRLLRSYESGETVNLEIMRDRNRMTIAVVVPERDDHSFNFLRFDRDGRRF